MYIKTTYLVLLIISLLFSIGYGQNDDEEDKEKSKFDLNLDLEQGNKTGEFITPQPGWLGQIYEKEINPDEYILGPGDQLIIKILGTFEQQFVTVITPEGFIVIPTIPRIYVGGKSIAEAEMLVIQSMEKVYKEAEFTLNLLQMRSFKIYVVGEVVNPGTYISSSINRASDVIKMAGGLTKWADETRVEIKKSSGDIDTVEINRFLLNGDLNNNPLLNGGETIFIPPIDLGKETVVVESNEISSGIYQLKNEESLYEFLKRINALRKDVELDNIIVERNNSQHEFNLLNELNKVKDFVLDHHDKILIQSINNRVFVTGEVLRPTSYPYLVNFTAKDYVGHAGLLETSKDINSIRVVHVKSGKTEKGKDVIVEKGDIIIVPRKTRDVTRDYLTIIVPVISLGLTAYALTK